MEDNRLLRHGGLGCFFLVTSLPELIGGTILSFVVMILLWMDCQFFVG
jgi:hypothetical protein